MKLEGETQPLPGDMRRRYLDHFQRVRTPPRLVESTLSTEEIVRALVGRANKRTLIVCDAYNLADMQAIGDTVLVSKSSVEEVREITALIERDGYERVIGVGGCLALDVAKAVGGNRELVVVPTIMSTNCVSSNRAVLGSGLSSFSFAAGSPIMTVVGMDHLMKSDPESLRFWCQSGFGDLFAEVSAAIDAGYLEENDLTLGTIRDHDPEVFDALEWVAEWFDDYNVDSVRKLARWAHASALKVLEDGTNAERIGAEHVFYKAVMELNPRLRFEGPSHGQLVAFGSLITVYLAGKARSDFTLFERMRRAFSKLSIPTTWEGMEGLGLCREDLEAAVREVVRYKERTLMGDELAGSDLSILDEIFGAGPLPK